MVGGGRRQQGGLQQGARVVRRLVRDGVRVCVRRRLRDEHGLRLGPGRVCEVDHAVRARHVVQGDAHGVRGGERKNVGLHRSVGGPDNQRAKR